MAAIKVQLGDYTVETIVNNKSLADAVTNSKNDAVSALQQIEPTITANDISLDESGKVVVTSQTFAAAITNLKNAGVTPAFGTNTGCGAGC